MPTHSSLATSDFWASWQGPLPLWLLIPCLASTRVPHKAQRLCPGWASAMASAKKGANSSSLSGISINFNTIEAGLGCAASKALGAGEAIQRMALRWPCSGFQNQINPKKTELAVLRLFSDVLSCFSLFLPRRQRMAGSNESARVTFRNIYGF
jgi:hypothetical protein